MVRPQPRLLFAFDDPTARGLAERIVALAAMDTTAAGDARAIVRAIPARPGMRAVGVSPEEFGQKLLAGAEAAFLCPLSWCGDFPCVEAGIRRRAPWLLAGGARLSQKIIPLVETRAHFIVMSDRIAFSDDGAGNVRILTNPGPRR